MYVAMLDRPWLETPFVFQGFEIRDQSEIAQLQSYCEYVYVDIKRGNLNETQVRALTKTRSKEPFRNSPNVSRARRKSGWLSRFLNFIARLGFSGRLAAQLETDTGSYKTSATVRSEAPLAKAAYELNRSGYESILDTARKQGSVNIDEVISAVTPTIESIMRNPDAMAWTIFSRKKSEREYSRAVATSVWSVMFGRHLEFDREALQDLAIGGLLLDIGNVGLPADIVNTHSALTDEQYEQVRGHVQIGLDMLQASKGFSENVLDMVRCHHERADGSGYPKRLKGNGIPIYGRIAGVADCYDAMTTKNVYSSARAAYESAREMNDMRGKQFQAEVIEQFFRTIGMFPTGSVVEFSNDFIGVVLEQNRMNPLRPKVMLLLDERHKPLNPRRILELEKLPATPNIKGGICITDGHEHGAFGIDPSNYFK